MTDKQGRVVVPAIEHRAVIELFGPDGSTGTISGTTQEVLVYLLELFRRKAVKVQELQTQANLGLATTRELLQEVKTRVEVPTPLPWVVSEVESLLIEMPEEALIYRTVDPE